MAGPIGACNRRYDGPMAGSGGPIEVEWQFNAVDVRPVARWLDAATVAGYTITPKPARRLSDAYFDTPDWRVHRAGYTCRIRWEGSAGELTLKAMADAVDGIRRREEVTQRINDPSPEKFLSEPGVATDMLVPLAGRQGLRLLFALATERLLYALADDEGVFGEIALDTTTIPVGNEDHPVRLSRVEVEVTGDTETRAKRFVDVLVASTALSPSGASKFEAALLATGQHPAPSLPDLGSTDVHDSVTVGELAFAVMRRNFATLLQNEAGTRLGRDPEALHDMRVATRRIRAAMSTFREYLSPTALAAGSEVAWLTRALGPVRDLDVQIERLNARMSEAGVDAEALGPYMEVLIARRDSLRKRMLASLDSRRYERMVERWTNLLNRGPARTFQPGRLPAVLVAPEVVGRRYRRVRRQADRIERGSPAELYHAARIQAKKLRYAAEFFGPLFGARAETFVTRVKELQDVLGDHQDAEVAVTSLRREAENRRLSGATLLAMGALVEHYRTDAERLRGQFPVAYRRVRGTTWTRLLKRMEARARTVDGPRLREQPAGPPPGGGE